jgi:hypothetical protein
MLSYSVLNSGQTGSEEMSEIKDPYKKLRETQDLVDKAESDICGQPPPDPYLELAEQYPHCDAYILHPRGSCEFCDLPTSEPLHAWRKEHGINHTGEYDPTKKPCPAELRRPKGVIDKWGGNVAMPPKI